MARFTGVSSFGITGTDGQVIIQEPPDDQPFKISTGLEIHLHIMKFSAKSAQGLDKLIGLYENYFILSETPRMMPFHYMMWPSRLTQEKAIRAMKENKLLRNETKI